MPKPVSKTVDAALQSLAHDDELSIRINGICMQPLINNGALVAVRKQRFYWPGDILVKRGGCGQLIAHRLIGFYPRKGAVYFVTRADSGSNADAAVATAQIIGRVSDGECTASAVKVPLRYRIRAVGQFAVWVLKRIARRLSALFRRWFFN